MRSYRTCSLFLAVFLIPAAPFAQPPDAPFSLSASVYPGSPEAVFSWSPPTSGPTVTGYILEAAVTPGGPFGRLQLPGTGTSFTRQFSYSINPSYARVRAYNASGESAPSNEEATSSKSAARRASRTSVSSRPAAPEFVAVFNVPPGAYHVRVRALSGSALGPPGSDVIIMIQ